MSSYMTLFRPVCALIAAALLAPLAALAAEPAIIAKARARLGSEAAIEGIKSIRYVGTVSMEDPKNAGKPIVGKVEMIFQKPEQQKITATYPEFVEVTALDGYEAWNRMQSVTDAGKWRMTLLDVDQIKRLRANTWETLAYFRGIERKGGRMEDQGAATIEGIACQKVAFIHSERIVFVRYFEAATGRLVLTETETGSTLRESGEIVAQGIKFPKTITTVSKSGDQSRTVTLTYDQVFVNETFPPGTFAMPPVSR